MDTSNIETQQGAVNPVDLSQPKPHVEVKEQTSILSLQMRRNWLQESQRLDCRPKDSLEHSGKS
jgi:hypothetical protein